MSREDRLRAYIAAASEKTVEWGVSDCCMFAGRWAEVERKVVLSLPTYRTEVEGRALIAAKGGMEKLWQSIANRNGLMESFEQSLGDIGLIELSIGTIGVIFCHGGVAALRADKGVTFLRPRSVLRVWTI